MEGTRESLGSRIGFIFLSAGCAIGLGNVWRFPYITGKYGGAAFVLLYLLFLAILSGPIVVMEFAVGRASQMSAARQFTVLEPKGTKWHIYGYIALAGNYLLMMFYTVVTGWMIAYFFYYALGVMDGLSTPDQFGALFGELLASPKSLVGWMTLAIGLGSLVCSLGLKRGVERVTKIMMSGLLIIMIALSVRSVSLPGAAAGLEFYLMPDFSKISEYGTFTVIHEALGQAFFTVSVGIGSMAIFGSYIGRDRSLTGETIVVVVLDTVVAFCAGLIIFPSCFAYGVEPGAGPGLLFVSLTNMFAQMPGGRLWGSLFFLFMSFAAMSTVIAVFEHIIANTIDHFGVERRKASYFNFLLLTVLSLPCALGFNVWSWIQPLGEGSMILDLEDFLVSNNMLPLGSMVYLAFCTRRYGWGWDNFLKEADAGTGTKFPRCLRGYLTWVVPLIILFVFVTGYYEKFFA